MIFNMMVGQAGKTSGKYAWKKYSQKQTFPAGYSRLEYLDTTGAEYFDSGYQINSTVLSKLKVVADMAVTDTSAIYRVSGTGGGMPICYLGVTNGGKYGYGNGSDQTTSITADTNRHTWTLDYVNGKYTVDSAVNITFTANTSSASPRSFYLSAYNTGSGATAHKERIYGYQFYENGVLVREYLPCKDDKGVACLYETVEGETIYASGGTPTAGTVIETVGDYYIGYVLSDDENAYPNDGYGDDGYYYVKVGATEVTPASPKIKSASGTVRATGSGTLTVTGLDFTPLAVGVVHANTEGYNMYQAGWGLSNEDASYTVAYASNGSSAPARVFSPTNGGFSIGLPVGYYGTLTYTWYAIGY